MIRDITETAPTEHTFPGLDTLRAVGALCVLTTHAAFWAGDYTGHGWVGTLLSRLDVGVALFFVLSGFLLSRSWLLAAAEGRPRPSAGRYAWKRFLRIVPAYLVSVVVALVFIGANHARSPEQTVATFLMVDVYLDTQLPEGLTQMWSLAVEVAFYAILPLVMLAMVGRQPRWRPGRAMAWLLIGAAIAVGWWLWGAFEVRSVLAAMPLQWLPGFLIWFGIGIALAWLRVGATSGCAAPREQRVDSLLRRLARRPGALWVAAVGLLLVSATPLAGPALLASPTPGQALTKNLLYAGVATLVVLPSVLGDQSSAYARLMANRAARHLGLISYSLFCIHLPVLHFVMWSTGWELFDGRFVQIWALTLAVSLPLAELMYRLVEVPTMRLRNLGQRPRRPERISTPISGTRIT